jgi:hypothetical protein
MLSVPKLKPQLFQAELALLPRPAPHAEAGFPMLSSKRSRGVSKTWDSLLARLGLISLSDV